MTLPHGPYVEMPTRTPTGSNVPEKEWKVSNEQRFQEMIDYIDLLVGRIMNQLDKSGVAENMVIIFTADNGTAVTAKSRGVERGCQIPFIVSGKNIEARGLSSEICDAVDILATLLNFAEAKYPVGFLCDGISLKPFVTGETDKHKDVIHACIGTTQLLRSRTHLLEVVNPVLSIPNGRFYYTGENHTGDGYIRAEGMKEYKVILTGFKDILEKKYVGLKSDNPYFKERGAKWLKAYKNSKAVQKHLHNHKDYIFYDEKLDETRD